jgi:hypothetical protein
MARNPKHEKILREYGLIPKHVKDKDEYGFYVASSLAKIFLGR